MRVEVSTNKNYYQEDPFFEENLGKAFGVSKKRDVNWLKEEFFGTTYEVTTKTSTLSQIDIFGFKNQPNRLEEDERLVLKVYTREGRKGKEYILQTGLFAGVVYYKGCQINISTQYGSTFLKRMLNYVNDVYVDTDAVQAEKNVDTNEFQQILAYLFIQSLERASSLGIPQAYMIQKQRAVKVRGSIDINEYLRRDVPFQGKVSTRFRERMYVQEIVDVLFLASRKLERKFGKEVHAKIHGVYQLLKQHYSGAYPSYETIEKAKHHRSLLNPVYSGYAKVLEYAEIILKDLDLRNSSVQTSNQTYGYLFDISQLFEVYLEKLLSRNFKDWMVTGQEELNVYSSSFFRRRMFPDLVMRHKYSDQTIVFDAKFKKMRYSSDDLDRGDFYQIHSYIHYYQPEVIIGGLIYPLSDEIDVVKSHVESLFGKQAVSTRFIVDGVYVNEGMRMDRIVQSENAFVSRINNLIESVATEPKVEIMN